MTPQEIQFLFTLRYNPFRKSPIPAKTALDFVSGTMEANVEDMIKNSISQLTTGLSRVALSYSAGVDSNVVLTCLREIRPDIKIELYTSDGKEKDMAIELFEKHKLADSIKIIQPESVLLNLQKYVKMTGEPRWNVYHHVISEAAKRDGHSLLLTGDGADELFAGYVFRYQQFQKKFETSGFAKSYLDGHKNDWLELQDFFLKHFEWSHIHSYLTTRFDSGFLNPIERVLYADFCGKLLYDFIPTSQAIQKWHGIKIASPFLERNLVNHALMLDVSTKLSDDYSIGKLPLRNILKRKEIEVSDNKMGFTYDLIKDWDNKKYRMVYLHPKTFDVVDYKWWERSSGEDTDYRIINKIYQTLCLSEYYKLQEREEK